MSRNQSLVEQGDVSRTVSRPVGHKLTDPMRGMLWTIAQHRHGWTYVSRYRGQLQVAEGLERRGLIVLKRDGSDPVAIATPAGLLEICRRWPVSPHALGTYEHQPGGWTPVEGVDSHA